MPFTPACEAAEHPEAERGKVIPRSVLLWGLSRGCWVLEEEGCKRMRPWLVLFGG